MRLLLDESLPRRLGRELSEHEAVTVPEMGWAGKTNGESLELARGEFDAFLTADQNLEYQQRLSQADLPVIILAARTNRLDDFRPLIPRVRTALQNMSPGDIIRLVA